MEMIVENPEILPAAALPRCVPCLGQGLVSVSAEDEEFVTCKTCNGKGHCRDCEEDGGCDAHGWGEPLAGDEEKSALLSAVAEDYEVEGWLRGHGARTPSGTVLRVYTVRFIQDMWLKTAKFSAKPTRHEKKEGKRAVLIPHRCAGKPCTESRCECRCPGCIEGRRMEWARLGY